MIAYVFSRSALESIYATIHGENHTSAKTAQKMGFHFEKQVIEDDGTPVDYYAIGR